MRPEPWNPPIELSNKEQKIVKLIKRAKLFVFLREIRHLLFDEAFQQQLSQMYAEADQGHPPVAPAQLALTVILQAYTKASDAEAIESLTMDRRWQLVVDCLDCQQAPFSQATLVRFRQALIIYQLDRRLSERTVELAQETKKFGSRQLRAALDSSPLWGAARVEDTYNLLGHALKKALSVIARQQGRALTEIASEMEADLVAGSSLKAALDLNWDNPNEKNLALGIVLGALHQVEECLDKQADSQSHPVVRSSWKTARQIETQDVEIDSEGTVKLRKGVAKNRRIAIEDEEMRHGRKNRTKRFDGYKRHILKDLDTGIVRAVGITMANVAEASVTETLAVDLEHQKASLSELHIDRAYLSSSWVKNRDPQLTIYCKAWRVTNGHKFAKSSFVLNWESGTITCPNQVSLPFREGGKVQFPKAICASCPKRAKCTNSKKGRSVSIHQDEKFIAELRERQLTSTGRAKLRERVALEHSLSHIGRWQGDKARYIRVRKNLFDLRRTAVVHNLHVLIRMLSNGPELFTSTVDNV